MSLGRGRYRDGLLLVTSKNSLLGLGRFIGYGLKSRSHRME